MAGTSCSSDARAGDVPVATSAAISAAIAFPIPFTVSSFPSRTRASRSGMPVTVSAAFSNARTLNGFSPFSARSCAIRSSASATADFSTPVRIVG